MLPVAKAHAISVEVEALKAALREASPYILKLLPDFQPDPEMDGAAIASFPLYGGTLSIRARSADQYDEAPIGSILMAVNWHHATNSAFTYGTYTRGVFKQLWDLAGAVEFASRAGDIPSED